MSDKWAKATWKLTNHLCRKCSGRVLVNVGGGPTGGGNPMWMCADCEAASAQPDSSCICWCGATNRGGRPMGFVCVRVDDVLLTETFAKYGIDADRGVVTVIAEADLREAQRKGRGDQP